VVTEPAKKQQHAGNNERACERPAAGLVRAGDQAHAEPPVERQQLRSRSLRGHAASIAPAPARSRGSAAKSTKSLRRAELADAGLLADLAAEVVELGAIDVADRADLDLVDLRRVQRERPLDADAEGVLADGEGLAGAGALPLDHEALEDLDPLPGPFDHAKVDTHGVAGLEGRNLAQLTALDVLDRRAHGKEGPKAAGNRSSLVRGYRIEIRPGGQYVAKTTPIRSLCGTVPHDRESQEDERLSPIMK